MSWKKVLKRLTIDADQLCCDDLRRDFLDFLEKYENPSTNFLNMISRMSCKNLENYMFHTYKDDPFKSIEEKNAYDKILDDNHNCHEKNTEFYQNINKKGDNFKREKSEGLHGWFSRRGGKESKGGKTQGGWIACGTCGDKGGPKPCGRADASKGTKRRCRPTCSACKTYKRRKGSP